VACHWSSNRRSSRLCSCPTHWCGSGETLTIACTFFNSTVLHR
jgi:hypothetical protein